MESGQNLLHYRLVAKIGEGGMGVVWKAVDTTLDREVAIKILPDVFSKDPDRLARFEREAKLLASLNHTNIATVHGLHESGPSTPSASSGQASSGQASTVRFLAMELVEGQDLSKRLDAGPLPIDEALQIARQIAEALETAHENGIIHRDLKPANVQVGSEGHVKVLDFGLAKALTTDAASGEIDPGLSPTMTSAGTVAGMILGTASYLSPEGAKGKIVDRRTDVWAFGVLLHEMLSGRHTFKGEGISETLAAVILKEPDLDVLPANTPPRIRELVRRCLIKDPRQRLRDIGEARIAIEQAQSDPVAVPGVDSGSGGTNAPANARHGRLWIPIIAGVALAAIAFVAGQALRPKIAPPLPVRMNIELAPEMALSTYPGAPFAISPDGRQLAVVMGQPPMLRIREMNQIEYTVLSGTEGAQNPFFSPDGQWLGFFAEGKLKKVSITGGAPLTLCEAQRDRGATWGPDDFIVLAKITTTGLSRISAAGGESEELTLLNDEGGERSHRWPQYLPGGRAILFTAQARGDSFDESSIEILDLDSNERKLVHRGGSFARYVPGGFLVFARENTLFAARFDLDRLELTGAPVPVVEGIAHSSRNGGSGFAFSPTGSFIYTKDVDNDDWTGSIVRFDRNGTQTPLLTDPAAYTTASISPDGRSLATAIAEASGSGVANVWVHDLERDVTTRLTFSESLDWFPSWSPDGRYVTFSSDRTGDMSVHRKAYDGSGEAEQLTNNDAPDWSGGSWSPDASVFVFTRFNISNELALVEPGTDDTTRYFLKTDANEQFPTFSPDGRWIAYQSSESGDAEIYVRPYPGPGGKWQISRGGGIKPVWSRDGNELFFLGKDEQTVYSVTITAEAGALRAGRPAALFEVDREVEGRFDVTPDGAFVMALRDAREIETAKGSIATIVLDWPADLNKRVP